MTPRGRRRRLWRLVGWLGLLPFAFGARCTEPVDPTQPPCGGEPVFYGEHCCNVNGVEWKCSVEDACGYGPGDCRSLEPVESKRRGH